MKVYPLEFFPLIGENFYDTELFKEYYKIVKRISELSLHSPLEKYKMLYQTNINKTE